jgi:transcriptional/translational regulatory protein YebC/TACO1
MDKEIDVRDVMEEDGQIIVYGEVADFHSIQEALKEKGITDFSIAEIQMIPQNEVTLSPEDQETFEKMIDALEELEDVQHVFHNVALED